MKEKLSIKTFFSFGNNHFLSTIKTFIQSGIFINRQLLLKSKEMKAIYSGKYFVSICNIHFRKQ